MKNLFLIALLLTAATVANGQPTSPISTAERVRLSGNVVDATRGEGVPYATVSLTDSLGTVLAAWTTDAKGVFRHDVKLAGRMRIAAAAIDFDRSSKEIELKAPATEVGTIELSKGVAIEGVTVSAAPPLVKAEIDKITYSVAADPEAPTNTLLDMMRKVPLVSVDGDDNVQMQGSSNFKVLVNGKESSMMDRNFKDVARSMPASSIKDIEVITSPSSKYEAEGIGGIINIVTDRQRRLGGYNGSLGLGVDNWGTLMSNAYLSAAMGKLTVSGNVSGQFCNNRPSSRTSTWQENFNSTDFHTSSLRDDSDVDWRGGYLNLQASYEVDSLNLVTFEFTGMRQGNDVDMLSRTIIANEAGTTTREFTRDMFSKIRFGYMSGSLDYQRSFRKKDRMLTASYKLSGNSQKHNSLTRVDGVVDYATYRQRSINDASFREHTLQLDFVEPINDKHSIEVGLKAILRQNDSDPVVSSRPTDDDSWAVDPARRNALNYDQYIGAMYGAYTFKLKRFSVKLGARGERTWNDGHFTNATAETPFTNRLFNLVPYATVSLQSKKGKRMSVSYTQRLSRPGIWYLNPYVNDVDPMNVSYGNPNLESEVGHTFNASYGSYGPKVNFNLSAGANFVNNAIEQVSTANEAGVVTSTYYNVGRSSRYNVNGYYSWRPSAKFNISTNLRASWVELLGNGTTRNSGWSGGGSINTRVAVWKNGAATGNLYYSAPSVTLQGESASFLFYGVGLQQRAFNQKVTISLSVQNPFTKERKWSNTISTATFYQFQETWYPSRSARLNVSWNFGKANVQVKRARRTIHNDDQKAGGESTSGGSQGGGQ